MARSLRMDYSGAIHHVMVRGNNKIKIFPKDKDKPYYLQLLNKYQDLLDFRFDGYCIMDNHAHLVPQTGERQGLSYFMLCLNTAYANYFKKEYNYVGHVYQGRYIGILVDADNYLVTLIVYIHLNPVRAGIVTDPANYPWSSHIDYLNLRAKPILPVYVDTVLGIFDNDLNSSIESYNSYILSNINMNKDILKVKRVKGHLFLGDNNFIENQLQNKNLEQRIIKPNRITRIIDVDEILGFMSSETGLKTEEIIIPSKVPEKNFIRYITIYLLRQRAHKNLTEIAKLLNISISAVSKAYLNIEDKIRIGDLKFLDFIKRFDERKWNFKG
jgi:REP element-mobilizing transposase RayT